MHEWIMLTSLRLVALLLHDRTVGWELPSSGNHVNFLTSRTELTQAEILPILYDWMHDTWLALYLKIFPPFFPLILKEVDSLISLFGFWLKERWILGSGFYFWIKKKVKFLTISTTIRWGHWAGWMVQNLIFLDLECTM